MVLLFVICGGSFNSHKLSSTSNSHFIGTPQNTFQLEYQKKNIRKCFIFLWKGRKYFGILAVKWTRIEKPNIFGGWGLKNIHHFGRALATMSLWRLNQWNSLRTLIQNYIPLKEEEDSLVCSWNLSREYSSSLGYKAMFIEWIPNECQW